MLVVRIYFIDLQPGVFFLLFLRGIIWVVVISILNTMYIFVIFFRSAKQNY